jgi:hypothetical protein
MTVQQWASIEAETMLDAFAKGDGADDLVCLHEAIVRSLCEAYAMGSDSNPRQGNASYGIRQQPGIRSQTR